MKPLPRPDQRERRLASLRALKMARSAHAYVRGSTDRFYEWMGSPASAGLPAGPRVWICGDAHVGNVGPLGRCAGEIAVELRDFDQTALGNPSFDLVRLALSLAMAARGSDLPGVTTARMVEELVLGYEHALDGDADPDDLSALPAPLRVTMKRAMRRSWKHLFAERLGGFRKAIPPGRRFWPLSDDERAAVRALVADERIRRLATALECRDDHAEVTLLDAAFWVKGCSSLGLWRAALLVEVGGGGDRDRREDRRARRCLLDVKQAIDTVATHEPGAEARTPADRVVAGARALAPALGERMEAVRLLDRSVFVRELLPQDLKVELDRVTEDQAGQVARYLGSVLGRAQGRQLDRDERRAWGAELGGRRSKNIDAPGWLWSAVVELVALHEAAYLEHCRRYALDRARRAARAA